MCTPDNNRPKGKFLQGVKGAALALLLAAPLAGCLHDEDDTIVLPLPDGKIPYSVVSEDLQDSLRIHGFEIHEGINPPNIEGTYLMSPMIKDYATDPNVRFLRFVELTLGFSNQIPRGPVTYKQLQHTDSDGYPVAGHSTEACVIGDGNDFTMYCYQEAEQTSQYRVKTVTLVSGTIGTAGITDCQYAIIYKEHEILDSQYQDDIPAEGNYRLFHDGDLLARRVSTSL